MTIDERLEALTHSVELIAAMQLKTEKELRKLARTTRLLTLTVLDHEHRLLNLEGDDEDGDEEDDEGAEG
jgi:hypothetical protein